MKTRGWPAAAGRRPLLPRGAVAVAMLLALGSPAGASPVAVAPDRTEVLVNKDLAGERWAISREVADGTVTGNVFVAGREPSFVHCRQVEEDATSYRYRCYGAGRCQVPECATDWTFLSETSLPKTFFEAGSPVGGAPAAISNGEHVATVSASLADSSPGTESPDRKRVLVSKDVGPERWAISRRLSDGTVTGNVFVAGQTQPSFLTCEQTGETEDALDYRCLGAGACETGDCAADWREISRPRLPKSFFEVGSAVGCPVGDEGPITDLARDCRGVFYVYRRQVAGEDESWAMIVDGSRVEVCRSGGPPSNPLPLCLFGAVTSATEVVLDAERKVGSGVATPLERPGRLSIAVPGVAVGRRIRIEIHPVPSSTLALEAEWIASSGAD